MRGGSRLAVKRLSCVLRGPSAKGKTPLCAQLGKVFLTYPEKSTKLFRYFSAVKASFKSIAPS